MKVWKRPYAWLDDRLGISSQIMPIIKHPYPRRVNWWYVFGSATLVAFIVQVVTGVVLAFVYVPAPNVAYATLEFITHEAPLGNVLRGIHFWGASAMVVLVFAHMFHVILIGSYKYPRELNWLSGVFLLLLTLGMAFTGQLLRWNQDAYWAVVVGAAQAARVPLVGDWLAQLLVAGQTVGGQTLTRFYATHVFLFPALMFLLIGAHLYLVIRHGVSEPPGKSLIVDPATYKEHYEEVLHTDGVPFWPDAAWKDVVFALAVGSVVLLLAVVVGPPELGNQADPTIVEAYPRPDWYFLWYFALLALIPAELEELFIVGFPVLIGAVLIALPFIAPAGERSGWRRPWAVGIVGLTVVSMALLVQIGRVAPWAPELPPPTLPAAVLAPLEGSALEGAMIYQREGCISCHQIAGVGGIRGPELTGVGDRLSREQLIWRILYGGSGMPAYGASLRPEETNALVDFLQAQTEE